jgi:hypothetical protein
MNTKTDELMFDYLLGMGQMQPEAQDLRRRQEMITALRGQAMQAPQGQMVGKHYVPPSFTQYASQLGQGYMAGQAQGNQEQKMREMNAKQKELIEDLRRQRQGGRMIPMTSGVPSSAPMAGDMTNFVGP